MPVSQESQSEPGGNTKTPGKTKGNYQMYRWFFTLKYESIEASQLSQLLKEISKKFTFSGEIGEGGFKHWQGVFSLKTKEYLQTCKNHFPNEIHLEPCKNWFKAINYCKKTETHIEGPYDENFVFVDKIELKFPWQKALKLELAEKADYRKIIIYIDKEGGKGKTDFALHMYDEKLANVFPYGGTKDIADCLRRCDYRSIIIFDIPRTLEDHMNWTAIECVKNGYLFAPKYESSMLRFKKPHVICFINFEPNLNELSKDRYDLRYL